MWLTIAMASSAPFADTVSDPRTDPVSAVPDVRSVITRAEYEEAADAPANSATPYWLMTGDSFTGRVDHDGDEDWVRIDIHANETVRIVLFRPEITTVNDPYLRLYNGSGVKVAYAEGQQNEQQLSLEFFTSTGGSFYISAGGSMASSDSYTMTAESIRAFTNKPVYTMKQIADYLTDGYWQDDGYWRHAFDVAPGGTLTVDIASLNLDGQRLARAALNTWQQATGINFSFDSAWNQDADITFSDDEYGAWTQTYFWGGKISNAHVNISTDWLDDNGTHFDSYSYQTYLHEIGHALGLGHAGHYDGSASYGYDNHYANDSWQATIMSYFDQHQNSHVNASYAYVMTPMIADLVAIRDLYGAAQLRVGDSVYGDTTNLGGNYARIAQMLRDPAKRDRITFTIQDDGGRDRLVLAQDDKSQTIRLNPGAISDAYGLIGNISIAEGTIIEEFVAGSGDDRIFGNAADNAIWGSAGDDTIDGGLGNDRLIGGAGRDRLAGGQGNDTYVVDAEDTIIETANSGTDTVISMNRGYVLGQNLENLVLGGTAHVNGTGNAANNVIEGNAGNNLLSGAVGNDTLRGGAGNDTLNGGAGHDVLQGGAGDDLLQGGLGNDTYLLDGDSDVIIEFADAGTDTVMVSGPSHILSANLENLVLRGTAHSSGTGNALNNVIDGNAGDNRLSGGLGDDTLRAGLGDDVLNGGIGADVLAGGLGDDTYVVDAADRIIELANGGVDLVRAGVSFALGLNLENLVLTGTAALIGRGNGLANVIAGNAGHNLLDGNAGDDRLNGGLGNDTLRGGAGADQFIFAAGRDLILDFQNDIDTIRIDDALWGGQPRSVAQVLQMASVTGGDTLLDFGNGNSLRIAGLTNVAALADDLVIF